MAMQTEDMIVRNLVEALERLQKDLDCVELWAAALNCFQTRCPPISRATTISCRALATAISAAAESGLPKPACISRRCFGKAGGQFPGRNY
jgi:hypothetical protein